MHVLINEDDVGRLRGELSLRSDATVPSDGLIESVEDRLTARRRLVGTERQRHQHQQHRYTHAHLRALEDGRGPLTWQLVAGRWASRGKAIGHAPLPEGPMIDQCWYQASAWGAPVFVSSPPMTSTCALPVASAK